MVVLVILVAVICIEYLYQIKMHDEIMGNRCREVSASIVGAMNDALSTGDNNVVRGQFRRLHEMLPEISAFVYGCDSKISFATDSRSIGRSINDYLGSSANIALNTHMLSTGEISGMIRKKAEGKKSI